MHAFYLHGFASSPRSSKATYLQERFASHGIGLRCPDFNEPEFETLTITRMLDALDGEVSRSAPDTVVLIGSSLGGLVAVEAAARWRDASHPLAHLVLLAPSIEPAWERWDEIGPGGLARWRAAGYIEVFHYAFGERRRLNYSFYEDAVRYAPADVRLDLPVLVFQGTRDASVEPSSVVRFADAQPRATLHLLDDEHQLSDSLPFIWSETARALSLRVDAAGL